MLINLCSENGNPFTKEKEAILFSCRHISILKLLHVIGRCQFQMGLPAPTWLTSSLTPGAGSLGQDYTQQIPCLDNWDKVETETVGLAVESCEADTRLNHHALRGLRSLKLLHSHPT